MFKGKMMFAQIADFLPLHPFCRCAGRYPSAYPAKTFSHLDQFLCMAFAQLTFRESLRDIEVCLRSHQTPLNLSWSDAGLRCIPPCNGGIRHDGETTVDG